MSTNYSNILRILVKILIKINEKTLNIKIKINILKL